MLNYQINPEHTVPTLDDNGEIIWDSHAISTYLVDKYASDDTYYPKDVNLRARCNQRLFFNNGNLFQRFRACSRYVFDGGDEIPQNIIDQVNESYNVLETLLSSDPYLIGEQLTVADICCSTTTECLNKLVPIDEETSPNIIAWLNRIKEDVPFYDEMNAEFVEEYYGIISATMEKNRNN